MSIPPNPFDSLVINEENYIIKHKGKEKKLNIIRTNQEIKFKLTQEELTEKYEGNFTLEDFIKLSNVFGLFNSLEEIQRSLNQMFSSNKYELKEINQYQINIDLKITVFEKLFEVRIPLIQKEMGQKDFIEKLMNDNNNLKNQINLLKEENKSIKLTLQKYQNDFDNFRTEITEILEKKFNPLKNSNITINYKETNLILNRLKLIYHFKHITDFKFELLYRGTRDGDESKTFHRLCDNKPNILVIVQTTKNKRFGGFCTIGYKKEGGDQKDDNAFVFSFDKMKIYNVNKGQTAVYWDISYGPLFAGSINAVVNKFFTNTNYANTKNNYYEIPEDYELNGGEYSYLIKELEVYQISW